MSTLLVWIIVVAVSLVLAVAYVVWFSVWGFAPRTRAYDPSVQHDGVFRSVGLPETQGLVVAQLKYVEQHIPQPFAHNKDAMRVLQSHAATASLANLDALFALTPWYSLGYYPAVPLASPRQLNHWQFGQGVSGWFWFIAHFADFHAFVSVLRVSPISPAALSSDADPLPSTAHYVVNAHLGRGTTITRCDERSGGVLTRSGSTWSLTVGQTTQVAWRGNDTFAVKVNWPHYAMDLTFEASGPPTWNNDQGCFCVDGLGTPYYSYSTPRVTGSVVFADTLYPDLSGEGWIDRQLGGTIPRQGLVLGLIQTLPQRYGLGAYVWTNLHLDGRQYMVYAILNDSPAANAPITAQAIKYTPGHRQDLRATLTPLELDGVFPVHYRVEVEGESTLLLRAVGRAVFGDLLGGLHWAGDATLTNENLESAGWGFIEGSQLESSDVLLRQLLDQVGIPAQDRHWWETDHNAKNKSIFLGLSTSAAVAAMLVVGTAIALGVLGHRYRTSL